MKYEQVEHIVSILKKCIAGEYEHKNLNNVLDLISIAARILYATNLYYLDDSLEDYIALVSKQLKLTDNMNKEDFYDDVIVFYDGFGLNLRGLVQIYLKALCRTGKKVVYITYSSRKNEIPDVLNILKTYKAKVLFIDGGGTYLEKIKQLNTFIQNERAGHFFFYSYPDDVVAPPVMNAYDGILRRYQVNLTDHAFWLGAKPVDICIEFRDYGAIVSYEYRKIPKEKLIKIPYYPIINYNVEFQGWPFPVRSGQKVIFSGGSLYKTLGAGNKYYAVVDHILSRYPDVIFWYAGSGDRTEIDKIISKYPERAYITTERSDLYQVLKHCYFYLSTYPVCGGLMFQYAAIAGKPPVTLYYDTMTDGLLFNQKELGIMFDNIEALLAEVDKLMNDSDYYALKCKNLRSSVISEGDFDSEVAGLVAGRAREKYKIDYDKQIETSSFRKIYLDNMTAKNLKNMENVIVTKRHLFIMRYAPAFFTKVALRKALIRLINSIKKTLRFNF